MGTVTNGKPLEITRLTRVPCGTVEPAWVQEMTLPAATVVLACGVAVPATRWTARSAVVAVACVSPVRLGTGDRRGTEGDGHGHRLSLMQETAGRDLADDLARRRGLVVAVGAHGQS